MYCPHGDTSFPKRITWEFNGYENSVYAYGYESYAETISKLIDAQVDASKPPKQVIKYAKDRNRTKRR